MALKRIVVASTETRIQQMAADVAGQMFQADTLGEAVDITQTVEPDMVILDHRFDSDRIRAFIRESAVATSPVPTVAVSLDNLTENQTEQLLAAGLYDIINGTADFNRLRDIAFAVKQDNEKTIPSKKEYFCDEAAQAVSMVGTSPAMRKAFQMIKLVAESRCNPVLIVGETGSGKELAARAVHYLRHGNKKFVAVNCAALTANLLESELFGHVKGAFTGAEREKTGLLELAGDGTLLLDEISEMPVDLQAKLLRVLQDRTFRKVGGTADITCKATIIASSNRNLVKQIEKNEFRRDLYYRLNICPVNLPPLRAPSRKQDIALLADYFIRTSMVCPGKADQIKSMTNLATEQLSQHHWPGNVRELKNVIERAIMLETTDKIGCSSIIFNCDNIEDEHPPIAPKENFNDFSLSKAEKQLIRRALYETGWQKTKAASLLGITRATLYAKVKQYNLKQSDIETSVSANA